jgi:flagellar biosynthesis protein FlhG
LRVLAVGGGKGGIGKSLVSSSLGIELARRDKDVVLVDADLGGANLHTCLGVNPPLATLDDLLTKRARIQDVAVPTPVPRLRLVAGALDGLDAANARYAHKQKFIQAIRQIDVDYVIVDLGAGTHFNVLDLFVAADRGVVVLVPEPTSIENVYRFMKGAFFRRLAHLAEEARIRKLLENAMGAKGAARTPASLLEEISKVSPTAADKLKPMMLSFRPALVVNQARTHEDLDTGHAVVAAWRKYFGLEMDYLGALHHDDEVWRAVRRRRPVLLEKPDARIALDIRGIVDELLFLEHTRSLKVG